MKEIKEKLNKWRHIPCAWIERSNIVKTLILHRLNAKSIKVPGSYFIDNDKLILKCMWKDESLANTTLKMKNKFEESCYPISRLTLKLQP